MWAGYVPPQRRQRRSACCGVAGTEVKLTGRANDGEVVGVMLKPQRPQKREFCGRGDEHRGHGKFEAVSPALTRTKLRPPQRPQNRTPSAKRDPHFSQATIPGRMLESLALLEPCDGEGWLAVARPGLSCAWISCSPAPSRISIRRSSSRSPARDTRKMCWPTGTSVSNDSARAADARLAFVVDVNLGVRRAHYDEPGRPGLSVL
jgi:hypothetical protein